MASRHAALRGNQIAVDGSAIHQQGCGCGNCGMDDDKGRPADRTPAADGGRPRFEDSDLVNLPVLVSIGGAREQVSISERDGQARPTQPVETPFVDTIPGDTSTTATIAIGGFVDSRLDTVGDTDWFRVELVAGQTYVFETSSSGIGDDVEDSFLRLHNSAGTQLAENDDGGAGLFSRIVFTATTSGTYYVNAGSYLDAEDGNYRVSAGIAAPMPVFTNDQIAAFLESGFWNGVPRHFNVTTGGTITYNLTALTAPGQNLAREAFNLWQDATGIIFSEIAGTANITLDDNQSGAFASSTRSGNIIISSIVNVGTDWLATYGTGLNSYSFQTYIHEIGHAIGLGHAGDYNGSADYGSDNHYLNDSWATTVMSYFSQTENSYFSGQGFTQQFVVSPIVADILATTTAYGTPSTTRTGDTTYGFNNTSGRAIYDATQFPSVTYTVVDHGGVDTLDYSGFSQTQTINLNAEAFSNVGGRVGNVTIARGTVIENAVGGTGNDTIIGNAAPNVIFLQRGGNDTVSGGEGVDGFYFGPAFTAADSVDGGAGADQIGLQGNYNLTLGAASVVGVEMLVLLNGGDTRFGGQTGTNLSYTITTIDANIAAGQVLTFQANTLRAGETFTLNGAAETDGIFLTFGGLGTDNLTGGQQSDGFYFGTGRFNPTDFVDGQGGTQDQIGLQGNFAGANGVTFGAGQLTSVEFVVLMSANDTRFGGGSVGQSFSYSVTMNDGNVAAGQSMIISANTLRSGESLTFSGAAETDGAFRVFSGAGNDTITGGARADEIWGGAGVDRVTGGVGADILRGGAGNDTFAYNNANESTSGVRDQLFDFALGDTIDLAAVATLNGFAAFTFVGTGPQTGQRQVQVSQSGTNATVFVYVDGDATADMVIGVTVTDSHALTASDFVGVNASQEPLDAPKVHDDWAWGGGHDPYAGMDLMLTRDLVIA